jgi:hypothetical protein
MYVYVDSFLLGRREVVNGIEADGKWKIESMSPKGRKRRSHQVSMQRRICTI